MNNIDIEKSYKTECGDTNPTTLSKDASVDTVVAAEVAAEQTKFDVYLTYAGERSIAVTKVVREFTGLGLKEARVLVNRAYHYYRFNNIKRGVGKEEAEEIKKQLEELGALVEVNEVE